MGEGQQDGQLKAPQLDLATIRLQFPVTNGYLYFNSANRTPLPANVRDRVLSLYDDAYETGGDKSGWIDEVEIVRSKLATFIGASTDEIAFTKNTSEGLNIAANSIPWRARDNILIAEGEHPNNTYAWLGLRTKGLEVRQVPVTSSWINADTFAPYMDKNTKAITLSHVTFHPGQRNDVESIAQLCHERGVYLIIDAMQSTGVINYDVTKLGASIIASGCHKGLMALPGHGFLYCNSDLDIQPTYTAMASVLNPPADFIVGLEPIEFQNGARRFEIGNYNYAGLRSLNASLDLINNVGVVNIEQHVLSLGDRLISHLDELGITILGPRSPRERRSHIYVLDLPSDEWLDFLTENKVIVTDVRGSIRVSFAMFNTNDEVDRLVEIIKHGLKRNLKVSNK